MNSAAISPDDAGSLTLAIDVAKAALAEVGEERVELLTISDSGRVSISPAHLADGESIARTLGLGSPRDHRMVEPGYTLWSGVRAGFEFEVRGTLRHTLGTWP